VASATPVASPGSEPVLRRVRGAVADELHLVCRSEGQGSPAEQVRDAYRSLLRALEREGATSDCLLTQTVFLAGADANVEAARSAAAGALVPSRPVTTFIGQAPLDGAATVEIAAVAMLPHRGSTWRAKEVRAGRCTGKLVRFGERTQLYAANLLGNGNDAYEEAFAMFEQAELLLAEAGFAFTDVMRTWIHLRDIDRDYDVFNRARREFFRSRGIERRPASTGVQGFPPSPQHDFSLGFFAMKSSAKLEVPLMHTPTLNEAWTYGADFSRGLRLDDGNKTALHISGTASIDEQGRTVHVGDFDAQAERMLTNIEALLEGQDAGFGDLVSAIAYLKRREDAPRLAAAFRDRGFGGFPCAMVEAPLCRPELLCETEAVAILHPAGKV
jgi:enamine deaminase RidA (YjgF/YER057c/UK114 family)